MQLEQAEREIRKQDCYQAHLFGGSISRFTRLDDVQKLIVTIFPRWQSLVAIKARDYLGVSIGNWFDILLEYLVS